MASTLYFLSINEDAQERLREELKGLLPTLETRITPEILNKMSYLKAVLKETMRVSPFASGSFRQTTKDLVLSGYQVPKGVRINTALNFL